MQKEFCLICGFSTVRKNDLDEYGHCYDRAGCERRKKSKEICGALFAVPSREYEPRVCTKKPHGPDEMHQNGTVRWTKDARELILSEIKE